MKTRESKITSEILCFLVQLAYLQISARGEFEGIPVVFVTPSRPAWVEYIDLKNEVTKTSNALVQRESAESS